MPRVDPYLRMAEAKARAARLFKAPTADERSAASREYLAGQETVRERMAAQRAARLAKEKASGRKMG
jgi:hypothetical protein